MIRIRYEEKPEMTFDDYDVMIACFKTKGGKRKKMKKTMKNLQILFYEGVLIVILSLIIYWLSDKPLQGWDVFFTYGFGAAGLLYMVGAKAMPLWLKKQFEKARTKSIKADIVFDEAGVHVWENPEKGFDRGWDQLTECFISSGHIFIFFQEKDFVLAMPGGKDFEERVLDALEMGGRMDIVIRFEEEKGRVKVL